ncbi:MAG: hypothetical protein AMS21_04260 [Gemmatimonas sp. SG8_38_2]|nr:MAG: hypothetical protein AMS21_04260 [Gemmatimonas sp. SG8_38_2]
MRGLDLSDTSTLLIRPRGILVLCVLTYLAAALHFMILAPLGWPAMEVLWSAMLIPTIALSFYFGWRGALGSVLIALGLFVVVEWLAHGAQSFGGGRVIFSATAFLTIVTLGIAIGGLAELLRREHRGRIAAERRAVTNEMAVALKHEINNPLAALLMEAEMLENDTEGLSGSHLEGVSNMVGMARRIQGLVDRIAELEEPKRIEYLEGKWMIDLSDD